MPNPRLAYRYAKSLIDLSTEKGQLEAVYADMQYIKSVCRVSRDFVNLLRSPVVTADQKISVLTAIGKEKISTLTSTFAHLLVKKGREGDLPEVASSFIEQYNEIKGIHTIQLTTAVPLSDDMKQAISAKVKKEKGLENIQLETKTDDSLIGGFVLEFNNNLVDASILRDLKDIKKQFLQNHYVQKLR